MWGARSGASGNALTAAVLTHPSLVYVDLSANALSAVALTLPRAETLHLSDNRLIGVEGVIIAPALRSLSLQGNPLFGWPRPSTWASMPLLDRVSADPVGGAVCARGSYGDPTGAPPDVVCRACPSGRYSDALGALACTPCPAGMGSAVGAASLGGCVCAAGSAPSPTADSTEQSPHKKP